MLYNNAKFALLATAVVIRGASASEPMWGQCGGIGWTGSTECVKGAKCCRFNPHYSQCLPDPKHGHPKKPDYWFSFGDSYTMTGFNPDGILPSDQNVFGNPAYPGTTSANGPNWVDFAVTAYNNSKIYAYNYAYGGATIDAKLVVPYAPTVQSLTDQVNRFLSKAGKKPNETDWNWSNSIFTIWIGINDLNISYNSGGNRAAFSDQLLDAEFALVRKLYDAGARTFMFANVPPVDRSPLIRGLGPQNQNTLKSVIQTHNSKLAARVTALQASQMGYRTFLWDTNALFTKILDSPANYGFSSVTTFADKPENFWFDALHPTTYAHKFLGENVGREVLRNTIW